MTDDTAPIERHRIFVYGSLRRGESNHDVWFTRGATLVADGRIQGAELVNLGGYCCILQVDDRTRAVVGEVYDLTPDLFQEIEAMESEARYVRRPVEVYVGSESNGTSPITADAYVYSGSESLADRPRIESGDWTQRENRRA